MENMTTYLRERFPHISFVCDWELTNEIWFKIGQCHAIVQSLAYLPLAPEIRQKMLNVSLVKGAQATTAIEGNTLSEEEVDEINKGATLPESRKYLETEVKNVINALNAIFSEVVHENHAAIVSPQLICNFHKLVGQNLGDAFKAIPGQFRQNDVVVGQYRAPDYKYVRPLMDQFCKWLQETFKFNCQKNQNFPSCVIEAIVSHVYLVWIHPFGDGNGRTARLLEFYLLLRGGLPNICSHILSNHYNQTRSEYYRHLEEAGRERSLTHFIEYAIQGLLDGLNEVLWQAQHQQIYNAWKNYFYEVLDAEKALNKPKRKRLCKLLSKIDIFKKYTPKTMTEITVEVAVLYSNLSPRSIARDLAFLVKLNLLRKDQNSYSANIQQLVSRLPESRTIVE